MQTECRRCTASRTEPESASAATMRIIQPCKKVGKLKASIKTFPKWRETKKKNTYVFIEAVIKLPANSVDMICGSINGLTTGALNMPPDSLHTATKVGVKVGGMGEREKIMFLRKKTLFRKKEISKERI